MQSIPQLEGLQAVPLDLLQASPFSFPPLPPRQAVLGRLAFSWEAVFLAFQIQVEGQGAGLAVVLSIPARGDTNKTQLCCIPRMNCRC